MSNPSADRAGPRSSRGSAARPTALRVGLVFETFETYEKEKRFSAAGTDQVSPVDAHVEFEPESTIAALESAIEALGHRPVRLGSPLDLLERLRSDGPPPVDAAFNLAEGFGSRNREAWAPVLLEMAGIPTLGSDAATLSLTLDKAWANRHASAVGIPVPANRVYADAAQVEASTLPAPFPLFVKPRWEGTAKGIRASSKVESLDALRAEVARVTLDYAQPALVEAFIGGPEYTVTLIGNEPVEVLPAVQRALEKKTGIGLHALEGPESEGRDFEYEVAGGIDAALEARLDSLGRASFAAFECLDFARADFRLDADGQPIFLEINPLPTFATDGTFAILAELEGISMSAMLGRCISAGLHRLGLV